MLKIFDEPDNDINLFHYKEIQLDDIKLAQKGLNYVIY